jgi:hypothetical protein
MIHPLAIDYCNGRSSASATGESSTENRMRGRRASVVAPFAVGNTSETPGAADVLNRHVM